METANSREIEKILAQRKIVNPEPELTPDMINKLRARIQNKERE